MHGKPSESYFSGAQQTPPPSHTHTHTGVLREEGGRVSILIHQLSDSAPPQPHYYGNPINNGVCSACWESHQRRLI